MREAGSVWPSLEAEQPGLDWCGLIICTHITFISNSISSRYVALLRILHLRRVFLSASSGTHSDTSTMISQYQTYLCFRTQTWL